MKASRLLSCPPLTTKEVAALVSEAKEITFQEIKSRLIQIDSNTIVSTSISELFQQHLMRVCQYKGYGNNILEYMSSLIVDVDIAIVK